MSLTQTLGDTVQKATLGGCRAIALEPVILKGSQTVDGLRLRTGDRCIVARQEDHRENGIYVVQAGEWRRAPDMNGGLVPGSLVSVLDGNDCEGSLWQITFTGKPRIGATAFQFARMDRDGDGVIRVEHVDPVSSGMEDRIGKLETSISRLNLAVAKLASGLDEATRRSEVEEAKARITDSLSRLADDLEARKGALDEREGVPDPDPEIPAEYSDLIRESEPFGEAQERILREYNDLTTLIQMGSATEQDRLRHSKLHGALQWVRRVVEIV